MLKLIVVDYQEGAGGEFMARFISAHFGHSLTFDQQADPDQIQKWLNSHSIIDSNWNQRFKTAFQVFVELCQRQQITEIAVPYHLYKWPDHIDKILEQVPNTRFVKINCDNYLAEVNADFQRKVLDHPIKNFSEVQFLLRNKEIDFIKSMLTAYKEQTLTYRDIFPKVDTNLQTLPSRDIEINYGDFFCNFDQTASAYEKLCNSLNLTPDIVLLSALIQRNKKNQCDLDKHLSTI